LSIIQDIIRLAYEWLKVWGYLEVIK